MTNSQIRRVGVIGGGQLAWMMADGAKKLGLQLVLQTPSPEDPAVKIADDVIFAPIDDAGATAQLATRCDVVTFENEFVDLNALQPLAQKGVCFRPRLEALTPLLDKYEQRSYLKEIGLPVPRFTLLEDTNILPELSEWGDKVVLKARRHGYDGYGTFIVKSQAKLLALRERFNRPSMLLEEFIPFEQELAVMAARNEKGEIAIYPVVETQQENQVCRRVIAPAVISTAIRDRIAEIAQTLLTKLQVVGIFGIELFLTRDGNVLVNEIAPRTHNSGHYTLDACDISQFEMHLRAVAEFPLDLPKMHASGAVMVNLLGYEFSRSDDQAKRDQIAQIPNAHLHWYGKAESRPGRKLGHVTVLLEEQADEIALKVRLCEIADRIESLWCESTP